MKASAGTQLRAWREAEGVSLVQVGGQLGCSQAWLSNLELGRHTPSLVLAVRIQRLTGIPPQLWIAPEEPGQEEVMSEATPRVFVLLTATGIPHQVFTTLEGAQKECQLMNDALRRGGEMEMSWSVSAVELVEEEAG